VESISDAGMHESFGTTQPVGMPGGKTGEKRECCGAGVEGWKPGGSGRVCFLLSARGYARGWGRLAWNSMGVPSGS